MRRARRTSAIVGTAVALLTTAACGARWDDEQHETVLARGSGGELAAGPTASGGSTAGNGTANGTAGATVAGGGPSATTPDGAPDPSAGGGGDPGATGGPVEASSGSQPCAAPSDAPGVTDSQIDVATISTVTGPVPGLGASAQAAVQAYVAYRNANGGVCGRQINLRTADDGADNGRHRTLVNEFSSQVLGLVGGLAAGDAGSAQLIDQVQMPATAVAISVGYQDAQWVFDINPAFADVHAVTAKYRYLHDQGATKVAIVYTGVEQSRSEAHDKQRPLMEAAGIEVALELELPLSTLSYDSAARAVANSGADYLYFLADSGASASMAQSMADTGYGGLKFAEYVTAYGTNFPELAGGGADGATSWIRTLPNEDGGSNPEQAAFLQWMADTAPDAVVDTFASDSWASAKAFFDSLEALPGPITRQALFDQLKGTATFDAGGFLGPIQLGPELSNGCYVAMTLEGGAWRRLTPDQGFLC